MNRIRLHCDQMWQRFAIFFRPWQFFSKKKPRKMAKKIGLFLKWAKYFDFNAVNHLSDCRNDKFWTFFEKKLTIEQFSNLRFSAINWFGLQITGPTTLKQPKSTFLLSKMPWQLFWRLFPKLRQNFDQIIWSHWTQVAVIVEIGYFCRFRGTDPEAKKGLEAFPFFRSF